MGVLYAIVLEGDCNSRATMMYLYLGYNAYWSAGSETFCLVLYFTLSPDNDFRVDAPDMSEIFAVRTTDLVLLPVHVFSIDMRESNSFFEQSRRYRNRAEDSTNVQELGKLRMNR